MNRRRTILIVVATVALVTIGWYFRWDIGFRAIRIVDPVVRRWAEREVRRLSDDTYRLSSTEIRVNADERTISIDTIQLTTDSTANSRRDRPLPFLTLRFHNCSLNGVDLEGLSEGAGLKVSGAGCDTVVILGDVPKGVAGDSTGSFLSLNQDLDLPRSVPTIRFDSITFPNVSVQLAIAGRDGGRTTFGFERLGVRLDSIFYRRNLSLADQRTLYSSNVTVQLDEFSGSREAADRLDIEMIRADLATGSFAMHGFAWAPLPGAFADSLGLRELEVDTLRLEGVDWRAFLTRGDAVVGSIKLRGARVAMQDALADSTVAIPSAADQLRARRWVLERTLRTIDRGVHLDTLDARAVRVIEPGENGGAVITVDTLTLAGLHFGFEQSAWGSAQPLGPLRLKASGVERRWDDYRTALRTLSLDLGSGAAVATGLSYGTVGTDADFTRRRRWRTDRIGVSADSLDVSGIDAAAWVRRGAYRAGHIGVTGLHLDVFSDKRKPSRGTRTVHKYPQEWFRTTPLDLHVDSATIAGRVTYRERGAENPSTGVLRFENLRLSLANGGTDPARVRGDSTIRLRATARLMGAGPLRLELTLPMYARQFDGEWSGSLGGMDVSAFNELLTGISTMRFTNGSIDRIDFKASIRNGVSRGTVQPRWRDLSVELPGVARTGILRGIRRAIAKFAANQFVVRIDNHAGMGTAENPQEPINATIQHRWTQRETLLQHLWFSLRDALVVTLTL
jgi:hypothetical protein